ncbi:ribonuclease E [Thiosulfatimonas sediminis]|uniref:Ribonuclease E n=1 Tax=Thiosulfatimonas sediminis TaxID=2675054 RepID=A0A6F8PW95_9GAMM|nr:ribonuclease E [Thiosulfatimonas sediminis]BBP46274.1 ribonuclease E [Thiosulfatimonas sediminis]
MKRMLINATQKEEVRIALVDGQTLYDLDVETPLHQKKKANIYKGKITRIEPSLEAAFVDYGADRHGFLPFKELASEYFPDRKPDSGRVTIKDVLKEGQEIIVQVQKEERGNKGAALTTQITLAGPYVVMMPNNPKAGGISRRIEGDDRSDIRDTLRDLETPDGMGLIIRTAGVGKSTDELQWGVNYLVQLWQAITKASEERAAPFLIHQESDIVILAIRDYLRQDIGEIIIDDMETFHKARDFIQHVMPQQVYKVKPYQDTIPLFTRFQIESQIESAYQREVTLPSGGAIVIDITEALTAIDINSSRATKGGDIEETAFNTNIEAACEIARQLRLRDLGGLVVIDFIDMHSTKHQREVENKIRDAVKSDRARVQIGKISRFGLLEMSRQRLRPSIEESTQIVCPRCSGVGVIRGVSSLGLSILRLLEEESMKENTRRVTVQLPVDVATFLLNEKRNQITKIEDRHNMHVLIVPNEHLQTPQYIMERTRMNDEIEHHASYENKIEIIREAELHNVNETPQAKEEPAVKNITPSAPPPTPVEVTAQTQNGGNEAAPKPGLFTRVWRALFGKAEEPEETKPQNKSRNSRRRNTNRDGEERRPNNPRRGNSRRRNSPRDDTRDGAQTPNAQRDNSRNNANNDTVPTSDENNSTNLEDGNKRRRSRRTNRGRRNKTENGGEEQNFAQNNDEFENTADQISELEVNDNNVNEAVNDDDEQQDNGKKPRQRRRSRYNSRSQFNSRRRAPKDAENRSIHSPAPHLINADGEIIEAVTQAENTQNDTEVADATPPVSETVQAIDEFTNTTLATTAAPEQSIYEANTSSGDSQTISVEPTENASDAQRAQVELPLEPIAEPVLDVIKDADANDNASGVTPTESITESMVVDIAKETADEQIAAAEQSLNEQSETTDPVETLITPANDAVDATEAEKQDSERRETPKV